MIKTLPIFILCAAITLHSCKGRSDSEQLVQVNESLVNSNQLVTGDIQCVIHSLEQKLVDPQTMIEAKIWAPPAFEAEKIGAKLNQYIDSLEIDIQSKQVYIEDSLHTLFIKLANYRLDLSHLLYPEILRYPLLKAAIERLNNNIPVLYQYPYNSALEAEASTFKNWREKSFGDLQPAILKLALSKIHNDILISAYQIIHYCDTHLKDISTWVDKYQMIATLSSSVVKAGQPIEVTVGLWPFGAYLHSVITINGDSTKLNEDGVTIANVKASEKIGKHIIPVRIQYWRSDGACFIHEKPLKYTSVE
jgi:hypothetical protein